MTCTFLEKVDAHFALRISPEEERALRAHLPGCAECTARYERQLELSRALPGAPSAEDRLGAALGFAPAPARAPSRRWWWVGALVPIAAVLVLFFRAPVDDGFTARGADAGVLSWLEVYVVSPQSKPRPASGVMQASDALAFAYRNPDGHQWLMVYGVDASGEVRWYYPEWSDPNADPAAVSISSGHEVRELSSAVAHPLPAGRFVVHAVFLDAPKTVRAIEGLLREGKGVTSSRERDVTVVLEVQR